MDEQGFDIYNVRLPIQDRPQAADATSDGWCGEASMQMALLYFGAFIPQKEINRLGMHALRGSYAWELQSTMDKLSMRHYSYSHVFQHLLTCTIESLWREKGHGVERFIEWQRMNLRWAGRPVITGILVQPSEAIPLFGCADHFVLTIGYTDQDCMIYNPNIFVAGSHTQSIASLSRPGLGLTHANSYNYYFGEALDGFSFNDGSLPVRLNVVTESNSDIQAQITVSGLTNGATYRLHRYTTDKVTTTPLSLSDLRSEQVQQFDAMGSVWSTSNRNDTVTVDPKQLTIFRCYAQEEPKHD